MLPPRLGKLVLPMLLPRLRGGWIPFSTWMLKVVERRNMRDLVSGAVGCHWGLNDNNNNLLLGSERLRRSSGGALSSPGPKPCVPAGRDSTAIKTAPPTRLTTRCDLGVVLVANTTATLCPDYGYTMPGVTLTLLTSV